MRWTDDEILKANISGDIENSILERDLDTVGNGTGTVNQAAVAALYRIAPAVGSIFIIDEVKIVIANAALGVTSDNWGGIAALAAGCLMRTAQLNTTIENTLRNFTATGLKTHYDLAKMFDLAVPFNQVDSLVVGTYKPPQPIVLDGSKYQRLVWQVQDNLATLTSQVVSVKGRFYTA